MKKNFFYATALVLGLAFTATACSDDDDNSTVNPADIEYNSENAASWHNYHEKCGGFVEDRCHQSL